MKNFKIIISLLSLCLFLAYTGQAQQTPAPEQSRSVLIVGGTAHLGTGDVIADAAIGFKDGKIDYVGRAFRLIKARMTIWLTLQGSIYTQGFIVSNSTIGLQEIGLLELQETNMKLGRFAQMLDQ